jgi:hypothetical protein
VHPLCTALRTRSVLSHPPGVKPQRPSPEIKQTPANALTHIHSQHIKNTHRHPYNTEYMQEKLLLIILKWKMPVFTMVFLSSLWLFSLSLHRSSSTTHLLTSKMRSQNLFYLRGSSSASLQVYLLYSITMNGLSSPESDLDLSHTHIKCLSYLQPAQRHGFYGSPA